MVLTDDNFATIIKAVESGRNIYENIKKAIQFLLAGNFAAILVVIVASLMSLPVPFAPVHLLFINLLTDSLPALAIGMEPSDKALLKKKPRDPKAGMFTKDFSLKLAVYGLLIAIAVQTAYYQGLAVSPAAASTMAFATLTLARLFHGFTCRSDFSIFKIRFTSNRWSLAAFAAGVFLLAVVLSVPFLQKLFMAAPLGAVQAGQIVLLAFLPTALIQLIRVISEHLHMDDFGV